MESSIGAVTLLQRFDITLKHCTPAQALDHSTFIWTSPGYPFPVLRNLEATITRR
jgi:hypothetical protein